jgi:hypothetical protein
MHGMKTKHCLAALLLLPSFAIAECFIEDESEREFELVQTAERAWAEYRDAMCELISQRDNEEARVEARATCLNFFTRQYDFEMQLLSRVLTFTNVRSILAGE